MASPVFINKLSTPTTLTIHFDTVFRNVEQQTVDDLKKLSYVRDEVVIALTRASADAAIKAIERYLPHLEGLMIAASTLPIEVTKSLKVSWTLPLSSKYNSSPFALYGSLNFEYVMLLMTYGVMHRNAAFDILTSTPDSEYEVKSKIIASLLCKSAGVFEHVRGELVKWLPKPEGMFVEFLDETYVALSNLSLAEAQQLAIKKAVLTGTSSNVIAKLCVDVANKCDQSVLIVRPFCNSSEYILQQFETYLSLTRMLFKALAAKHLGIESSKASKFGLAIGFMVVGLSYIPEELKTKNMPLLDSFVGEIRAQRKDIDRLFVLYTNDNNSIYFEKVVEGSATALPEGKGITKSIQYIPLSPVPIQIITKKGMECILQ